MVLDDPAHPDARAARIIASLAKAASAVVDDDIAAPDPPIETTRVGNGCLHPDRAYI